MHGYLPIKMVVRVPEKQTQKLLYRLGTATSNRRGGGEWLAMSGVIAVLMIGLLLGRFNFSPIFWETLTYIANALIFFNAGAAATSAYQNLVPGDLFKHHSALLRRLDHQIFVLTSSILLLNLLINATTMSGFLEMLGKDTFKVTITPLNPKEHVRIHVPPPLDRGDGSFMVRYRMYNTAPAGLSVQVLHQGVAVAKSPYILPGPVYHEYCDCPEADTSTWVKVMQCPSEEPQIRKDFASFPSIDLRHLQREVPLRFSNRGGLIHYAVIDNRVYRRSLGKYTDFKMFSDEMLLSLTRKVNLPDVEFYINVGDWPMETRKADASPGPVPILSWCGSTDTRDIVLPTYDVTHSTLETMRGVTNDLLSIQGHSGPPWANKTEKAFFRGRDSREERLYLVSLSKKHPELLDAGITGWFFFRDREKDVGKSSLVGFFDFFKFKYQVNVDGTVAAYRFPYLMLGSSLVLKQNSPYYEHFYLHLHPGAHYIPVQRNLSDIVEKIEWAKNNNAEAEEIAKAGQGKARELLQPSRLYCYYYTVLEMYSQRQSGKPTLHVDMELVPQPDDPAAACRCEQRKADGERRVEKEEL